MNSEAEFIAALAASPDDELAYRAFADFLEERGDVRAAWVRSAEVRPWMGEKFENPIPTLIDHLRRNKKVTAVRRVAAEIGAVMVPDLVELLKHKDAQVRLQVIRCFRRMRKAAAEAVPALVEALKDPEGNVREQAVKAIKDCGAKKVADTAEIRAALFDDNIMVRRKAASILGSLGARAETLEGFTAQLDDPDPNIRLAAVGGLGNLQTKTAIAPLCRALSDEDRKVREAAATWLSAQVEWGMDEVVGPLTAALTDQVTTVKRCAIEALGKLKKGAAEAVPELVLILGQGDADLSPRAAEALGEIAPGDEAVRNALLQAVRASNVGVAVAAARALDNWPSLPAEAASPLLDLYQRLNDRWERSYVLPVLGRLERPTPAVLTTLREAMSLEEGAITALGRLGPAAAEAIPELAELARGDDEAALALGHMGEQGIARLIELLDDPGEYVPLRALRGLHEAGEAALPALPRLLQFLRASNDSSYETIWTLREVCSTIRVLGTGGREAIPDLLNQLDTAWGQEARKTLSSFGPELIPYLPHLVSLLRDPERYHTYPAIAELLVWLTPHTTEVIEPFREALRAAAVRPDDSPDGDRAQYTQATRARVATALSSLFLRKGAAVAVPDLLPLLQDPSPIVRQQAAETLGDLDCVDAVAGLRAALDDRDDKVRALTAVALGKLGDASAAPELTQALRDSCPRVRRESATALGKIRANTELIVAALRRAEQDGDRAVQREASAALWKIDGRRQGRR